MRVAAEVRGFPLISALVREPCHEPPRSAAPLSGTPLAGGGFLELTRQECAQDIGQIGRISCRSAARPARDAAFCREVMSRVLLGQYVPSSSAGDGVRHLCPVQSALHPLTLQQGAGGDRPHWGVGRRWYPETQRAIGGGREGDGGYAFGPLRSADADGEPLDRGIPGATAGLPGRGGARGRARHAAR